MMDYQAEISRLEAEVQAHQRFLQRDSLFTIVGIDQEQTVTGWDSKRGIVEGLKTRNHDFEPYALHFVDNTNGQVRLYFETWDKQSTHSQSRNPTECVVETYESNNNYITRPVHPAIILFPRSTPIDFYTNMSDRYLDVLNEFKKKIMKNARNEKNHAEGKLGMLLTTGAKEEALRKDEVLGRMEADKLRDLEAARRLQEQLRNGGIKI